MEAAGDAPRAARILIPTSGLSAGDNTPERLSAQVLRSQFRGDGHLTTVALAGMSEIELQVLSRLKLRPGETIGLTVDPSQIRWFNQTAPKTQQERLEDV
jgi:iron(III) transport system ATP-binding protein